MDDIADLDRTVAESPDDPAGDANSPRKARPGRDAAADQRAFVVQLAGGLTGDAFRGRVQQLSTLDGGEFSSAEGMVAMMRRVLERKPDREDTADE